MIDIHAVTNKVFDRVHRTGEEIKNDLPNWVERFVEAEGWTHVIDPATGKPFENVGQWLVANYPNGPGMGDGRFAIGYDEFIALCDDRPKLKKLLKENRPKRGRGGDRKSKDFKVSKPNFEKKAAPGSRVYIEERLQRDHPEIWEEYAEGGISARQAGIKAGFIKDGHNPLMRLKTYWKKATPAQKRAFKKWLANGGKD